MSVIGGIVLGVLVMVGWVALSVVFAFCDNGPGGDDDFPYYGPPPKD